MQSKAEFFMIVGVFLGFISLFFRYIYFNNLMFNIFAAAIVVFIVPTAINTIKAVKVLNEIRKGLNK